MLVSVVIPSYNEEKDISVCLESLKEQSFKDFEIILVDDGSIDNTLKIVQQYKNIKILKQNHQGPGKARNLGAQDAKGKLLVFVDSDMHFNKDYIKNLIKPIIKDKTGKIIGTTHEFETATNLNSVYSLLWGKIRVSKEDAKNVKIFRAIKKDKFLELGGFDAKYGYADDQTFWFKYQIKPLVAKNTICYHKNPETLKATFKQARWIGASWKERFFIFKVPIIAHLVSIALFPIAPFVSFIKSIKIKQFSFSEKFNFYFSKFLGYATGITRAVYLGRVWK